MPHLSAFILSFSPDLIPYYGVELSGIRYSSIRGVNNRIKEMSSHTSARLPRWRRSILPDIQIRREGTVPVNQVLIAIHESRENVISVVRQGAPMTYSIELLSGNNAHQWEEFNAHSREGTLFHNLRWKEILEEEFGLKLKYYLIRDDRKVIGICPFIARSVGLFQGLESILHSEYTNAILDDSFDASQMDHLLSTGAVPLLCYDIFNSLKERDHTKVNLMSGNIHSLSTFNSGFNPQLVPYYGADYSRLRYRILKGLQERIYRHASTG